MSECECVTYWEGTERYTERARCPLHCRPCDIPPPSISGQWIAEAQSRGIDIVEAVTKYDTLRAEVERLTRERQRDALDGQAALDEANNLVVTLRAALKDAVDTLDALAHATRYGVGHPVPLSLAKRAESLVARLRPLVEG